MAREIYPSSYECECGHLSHFFENTIREAKARSQRKPLRLLEGENDEHAIVFHRGEMVEVLCPRAGQVRPAGKAVRFQAVRLGHRQRAPWERITHVKLSLDAVGDTVHAQRVLDHIRAHADAQGLAALRDIAPEFPGRKKHLGAFAAMRENLRHMANRRDAGENELNKGLMELGWLE
jgi:hypothetical protein